jgi:hypothetical protein
LAFHKVNLGFNKNIEISDTINPTMIFGKSEMLLQDFIAAFHIYLKAKYKLKYLEIDDDILQSKLVISSSISIKNNIKYQFKSVVTEKGVQEFTIIEDGVNSVFEL